MGFFKIHSQHTFKLLKHRYHGLTSNIRMSRLTSFHEEVSKGQLLFDSFLYKTYS